METKLDVVSPAPQIAMNTSPDAVASSVTPTPEVDGQRASANRLDMQTVQCLGMQFIEKERAYKMTRMKNVR